MSKNSEIFISYAWGDKNEKQESREIIVNALYETLSKKGFNVIRDKVNLGYGGNISEFMKKMGRGKYVVVIVSDKYLKSEYCMFEIFELLKNSDYKDRIFPIILSDANIFDELNRLEYLDYWSGKRVALEERIRHLKELKDAEAASKKLKQYDDIRETIDRFTAFVKDVNSLTPDMHSGKNFIDLITYIERKQKEDSDSLEPGENENMDGAKIPVITPSGPKLVSPESLQSKSTTESKRKPIGKIAGIAAGVLLLAFVIFKFAINGNELQRIGTVTGTEVNVRSDHYTVQTKIVGKVKLNDKVRILESKIVPAIADARMVTQRTLFYYGINKQTYLNSGKAVKYIGKGKRPNSSRVEVELDVDQIEQGFINSSHIKKLEGSKWHKISFEDVKGWIHGSFINESQ